MRIFLNFSIHHNSPPVDQVDENLNREKRNVNKELLKRILDMEIELLRAKEKIKHLEEKLENKTTELKSARKETNYFKREFAKLKDKDCDPMIRSSSFNVSYYIITSNQYLPLESIEKNGIEQKKVYFLPNSNVYIPYFSRFFRIFVIYVCACFMSVYACFCLPRKNVFL